MKDQEHAEQNKLAYKFDPIPEIALDLVSEGKLTPTEYVVLAAFLRYCPRGATSAWTTIKKIEERTRLNERTIQRALKKLGEGCHGLIVRAEVAKPDPDDPRNRTGYRYHFRFPGRQKRVTPESPSSDGRVTPESPGGCHPCLPGGVTHVTQSRSLNSDERKREEEGPPPPTDVLGPEYERAAEHIRRVLGDDSWDKWVRRMGHSGFPASNIGAAFSEAVGCGKIDQSYVFRILERWKREGMVQLAPWERVQASGPDAFNYNRPRPHVAPPDSPYVQQEIKIQLKLFGLDETTEKARLKKILGDHYATHGDVDAAIQHSREAMWPDRWTRFPAVVREELNRWCKPIADSLRSAHASVAV